VHEADHDGDIVFLEVFDEGRLYADVDINTDLGLYSCVVSSYGILAAEAKFYISFKLNETETLSREDFFIIKR